MGDLGFEDRASVLRSAAQTLGAFAKGVWRHQDHDAFVEIQVANRLAREAARHWLSSLILPKTAALLDYDVRYEPALYGEVPRAIQVYENTPSEYREMQRKANLPEPKIDSLRAQFALKTCSIAEFWFFRRTEDPYSGCAPEYRLVVHAKNVNIDSHAGYYHWDLYQYTSNCLGSGQDDHIPEMLEKVLAVILRNTP